MKKDITEVPKTEISPPKPKRLNPKQKKTIDYWFDPSSETYGNLTRSAIKAGFRPKYALNLAGRKPSWLYDTVESSLRLEQNHIIRGVQNLATKPILDSRSPDDTRLNAFTQLGKWAGLEQSSSVTNIIVQPILGGSSVAQTAPQPDKQIIDIDPID